MIKYLRSLLGIKRPAPDTAVVRHQENVPAAVDVGTKNQETRDRWLERKIAQIPAGSRVLDAGAGEQRNRQWCGHLTYVAQDFGMYDGLGDNKGLHTGSWNQTALDIVSDITAIPEPEGSFDAVLCTEVFEHLPDPVPAIREFARLLRKGGVLVLTAPFCSLTHFAPYHYSTGFNRYYYEKHLADNGFAITEIAENGNFFEYVAQEVRRIGYVAEKYCAAHITEEETGIVNQLLYVLEKLSAKDSGSKELLCFGYHIFAQKQ